MGAVVSQERSIGKQFVRFVAPNVIGMIGISVYILADTFFIANGVGAQGLAALNFALVVWTVMQATGLMIGIGAATRFQVYRALGDTENAHRTFTNALYLAALAAVILLIAGTVFATPLSSVLGADSETLPYTEAYLRVILSFSPFFLLNNVMLPFVRNDGAPRLAMAAMLVSSFANIIMDYIFVIVLQGGMFGAAIATGFSPIISTGILLIHVVRKNATFRVVRTRPQSALLWAIIKLGFSSFIVELSNGVVLLVFNLIILSFEGNIGVAAYGIVANLAFVGVAIFVGIAQGLQPLASKCHALKQADNLKKVLRYTVVTALCIAIIIYAVVFAFAEPLALIFNRDNDPQLTALAVEGIRIYFFGFFFACVNIVCAAFFSAVEQPLRGLIISVLRGLVAIIAFVALLAPILGMVGVWSTFPAAEAATLCFTVFFLICFVRKLRQEDV